MDSEKRERFLGAVLDQAAVRGWRAFSVSAAARDAGVPGEEVFAAFPDKDCILTALSQRLSDAVEEAVSPQDLEGLSEKDRILEVLLARFEAANRYRDGYTAALKSMSLRGGKALLQALHQTLNYADIREPHLRLKAGCAYLRALRVWQNDKTPMLSETMAKLDKILASRSDG